MKAVQYVKNNPEHEFKSFLDGAVYWFHFGFKVIPLQPKGKVTAVKWDGWLDGLSEEKIRGHWTQHPDHEVGFIVGDGYIVFDADTPESKVKLCKIEKAFDISPLLITKTKKGEHHFFRRPEEVFAKSDSHSTVEHPDRLDVKTGRALVVLAPSTGKEVDICEVDSAVELSEVSQDIVDAVARSNGRPEPRLQKPREYKAESVVLSTDHKLLTEILNLISPDCGYEDWLQVLMAIYHETGGSDDGLNLADSWSSNGRSYKGRTEVESKWRSFKTDVENPVTIKTLIKKLDAQGIDWMGICSESLDAFEVCEDFVSSEAVNDSDLASAGKCENEKEECVNSLDKFSLRGMLSELESHCLADVYVLENIAILGQLSVIYAEPNSGKTLLVLWMLIEAIKKGSFKASQLYYINVDDNLKGLTEKLRLSEEYGFNMISDAYKEFNPDDLASLLISMIEKDEAYGTIIVLDTFKKFTNLMNKNEISEFNKVARKYAAHGGTVLTLAHTNKNRNAGGQLVYGGTNDVMSDFDCAYNLDILVQKDGVKTVVFNNTKKRGNVKNIVTFSYSIENNITYTDLLSSVVLLDDDSVASIKKAEDLVSDAEIIKVVETVIFEGITSKMKLRDAVSVRAQVSLRKALEIIEKYSGEDIDQHRWFFKVVERGAHQFHLLSQ